MQNTQPKTYFTAPLLIKSRSESKDLERKIKIYHNEAMQNMQEHFGDDMMRQLCKQGNFAPILFFFCGRLKTSLGQAQTRKGCKEHGQIKMHKKFFVDNSDKLDVMRNTYIHELAHVLINRIYGRSQKHNSNWTRLFKILGGNGERCHSEDISNYIQKKAYYVYACACNNHNLTARMHKNFQINPKRYQCRKCEEFLTFEYKG